MEEKEKNMLNDYSKLFKAENELDWASTLVKKDILTSFERVEDEVIHLLENEESNSRLDVLGRVWEVTKDKGYINEKEANLLLGISRKWDLEREFIDLVKSN